MPVTLACQPQKSCSTSGGVMPRGRPPTCNCTSGAGQGVRPVHAALVGAACYRSQSPVSAVGAGPSCAHLDHSVQLLAATPRLSSLQTRARQGRWAQWSGDGRVGRQVGSLANWATGRQAGGRGLAGSGRAGAPCCQRVRQSSAAPGRWRRTPSDSALQTWERRCPAVV